ncbi:MAG: hypothetical protein P8I83_00345 [Paracoccaceae bacterium]|nr:hypothetical protein [Paracoccaceae bacterium]
MHFLEQEAHEKDFNVFKITADLQNELAHQVYLGIGYKTRGKVGFILKKTFIKKNLNSSQKLPIG